jgi:DNA-binding NarL/FixJ family response regulator
MKFLLIDDGPVAVDGLRAALAAQQPPAELHTAETAAEGLRSLRQEPGRFAGLIGTRRAGPVAWRTP